MASATGPRWLSALLCRGYKRQSSPDSVARKLKLQRGTMLVFDRGYTDYEWFRRLTEKEMQFVTRLKEKAAYLVVASLRPDGECILADEIIAMEKQAQADQEIAPFLRRVRYWDETAKRELVFLTNHLELPAATIAAIYKERWQIGVSSQGHIVQSVRDRPRSKDSGLVAGEAPWCESKNEFRWLRRSITRESSKGWPKRVRNGSCWRSGSGSAASPDAGFNSVSISRAGRR